MIFTGTGKKTEKKPGLSGNEDRSEQKQLTNWEHQMLLTATANIKKVALKREVFQILSQVPVHS